MLNPKSLLKVLPVVLLTIVQIVGPMEVARSAEVVVQQPANQNQTINQLIQQLKTGLCGDSIICCYCLWENG